MRRRSLVRCMTVVVFVAITATLGIDPGEPDPSLPSPKVEPLATIGATGEPAAAVRRSGPAANPLASGSEAVTCEDEPETQASARVRELLHGVGLERLQGALTPLSVSTNPEHLLALGILRSKEDVPGSIEILSRALALDPDNPLILVQLGAACTKNPEAAACTGRDFERDLLEVDGGNGVAWARIAAQRYQRGDREGALDAMHRAAFAPAYHHYGSMLLFERALAASTNFTYAERVAAAMVLSVGVGREIELVAICGDEAARSPEWRRACASLGARMEADAEIVIGVAAGFELQGVAHKSAGETAELSLLERRQREFRAAMLDSLSRRARVFSDEVLLSEYMEELIAYGEVEAMRYVNETVGRLEAMPGPESCGENRPASVRN